MNRNLLTIGLLALAAAGPATALTLTYSDRGTWTSQVTSLSNFDSGAITAGTFASFNTSGGLAVTDLQIVGFTGNGTSNYFLTQVNAGASQTWYQWGSGTILRSDDKTAGNTVFLRLNFSTPVSAFGFNFGAGGSSGAPASVTVSPGGLASTTVTTLQQPNFTFFGVTSDTQTFSFADIYINDTGRYLIIDDIARGSYSALPPNETAEPGTLLQMAMGIGLLAVARRRFSHSQAQSA